MLKNIIDMKKMPLILYYSVNYLISHYHPRTFGRFYITVLKSVLIFVSDKWVVMTHILRAMGNLYNWVAQQISLMIPHQIWNVG